MQCAYTAPIVQPTECLLGDDTDCGQGYLTDSASYRKIGTQKVVRKEHVIPTTGGEFSPILAIIALPFGDN